MTANDIKFRCSSLGFLMTNSRSKSETLSETTKTHLVDVFVSAMYGRREEIKGDALDKGTDVEEDSITLLSKCTLKKYVKNDKRFTNDFITGEPDIISGDEIIDIKSSYSAHTFFRARQSELDKKYFYQVQGYCALTGCKSAKVAFCLSNSPVYLIEKAKRYLSYDCEVDSPQWYEGAKQIELNHIFNLAEFQKQNPGYELVFPIEDWKFDIELKKRVFIFKVERDEEIIQSIYKRVTEAREWMQSNLFNV